MASKKWISDNKDKVRKYRLDWYYRNKKKQRAYQIVRKKGIHDWVMQERSKGCELCSEKDPVCIDFHHKDSSNKDYDVGVMRDWSKDRIKEEIDKCIRVCSNCHRKIHAGRLTVNS